MEARGFSVQRKKMVRRDWSWWSLVCGGVVALGCGGSAAPAARPPGEAPTPASVTVAEPGGDADDPHWAALNRQLLEPWGQRNDKDNQLLVPLPDAGNWKRIRVWGVEHFVAFRYGKQGHALTAGVVQEVEAGEAIDSLRCLRRFDKWARPQLRAYDVKLGPIAQREVSWKNQSIMVESVDGHVDWGFSRRRFSAAWAAYPAYPNACLVYAVGVQWGEQEQLAKQVRDRFLLEAFQRVEPLTAERPYRH
jgi:hypothetical protein